MSTAKKNITGPFRKGAIQGVNVRSLKKYQDNRGWLTEIFRSDELASNIIPMMAYISEALPGATRGPHEHEDQTDHFCFLGPRVAPCNPSLTVSEVTEPSPRWLKLLRHVLHGHAYVSFFVGSG